MGVEPTYSAWEANVLPINYIRVYFIIPYFLLFASINPRLTPNNNYDIMKKVN